MSSSLGWRTQSTVLPSKAQEIRNVSARSMFDWKAALYAKEEESRRGTRTVRKRKRRVRDDEGLEGENKGVASRAEKEELEVAQKLSGAALREKSKLYEELKGKQENEVACTWSFWGTLKWIFNRSRPRSSEELEGWTGRREVHGQL